MDKFEEINNGLISVNVYEIFDFNNKKTIVLHKRTKTVNAKHHVNLLKISNDKGKYHYVYIKNYDRLIGNQTNNHKEKYHCPYCQHGFKRKDLLDKHLERGCLAVCGQSVQLPNKGDVIEFKNHKNKFKCPYVIYGDFECLTTKTCIMSKPVVQKTKSIKYQNHKPSGFKLNVVNSITEHVETHIYRGYDCMDKFYEKIKEIETKIMNELKINNNMIMTEQDKIEFFNTSTCYLCGEEIKANDPKGHKVRDHCHFTGKYRGCAHKICNLKYNYLNFKIPVFFHNLKNYDAHLIIGNYHNLDDKKKIEVIAQNSEKFITFGFNHLRFKDTFSFLSSSLEKLIKLNKYVTIDGKDILMENWQDNFKFSKKNEYVNNDDDLFLLTEKGIYPYDYMDNWDKFKEKELPRKEKFYSILSGEHLSNEDYERSQKVW